jgi:transposase-like protein
LAALTEKKEKPISRIALDVGINEDILCRWIQQGGGKGRTPSPGHGRPRDQELAHLRKEVKAPREYILVHQMRLPKKRGTLIPLPGMEPENPGKRELGTMGTTVLLKPAMVQKKAFTLLKGGAKHILLFGGSRSGKTCW